MARISIGRLKENDIVLDHETVSRRHAELVLRADGQFDLVDLDSSLGSFVHTGTKWVQFTEATVASHEPLRFGAYEITVAQMVDELDITAPLTLKTRREVLPLSKVPPARPRRSKRPTRA